MYNITEVYEAFVKANCPDDAVKKPEIRTT